MGEEYFTVKQFANMIGTTVRTLQYYDRKGVLKPADYTEHGHRLYTHADIFKAQKIVTLKYLGFSLKEIIEHLSENAGKNMGETLEQQKKLLQEKREHLDHVIRTISRVEKITETNEIDSDLLLTLIHATQTERHTEAWLAKHLSPSTVEQIFMRHLSEEERLVIERETMIYIQQLQQFHQQRYLPYQAEVQTTLEQLMEFIVNMFGEELLEQIDELELEGEALFHFSFMSLELEKFIGEAIDIYMEKAKKSWSDVYNEVIT
ncbi:MULTISPECIES: MerR family transcriptional regulator [Clostridia]|uniref:MerR family transcriptional regulator n=1 Tax=Clostridia TaxID=186801 RepID=UPI000EA3AB42|nr:MULTISPECIES: MerR family transcriptional regulator [Clostridia]NBJ70669.1 MerR family transcriptional regulator [Roseburia sp. 1XD42-34]RKI75920.1 MerR family transcriptional regulator [Clostridium sp. 1xD42-85]